MRHAHRLLAPRLLLVLLLSGLSGCAVFQLLGIMTPDSPTGLTVGNATSSSLEILWDSPKGAKGYEVYRSASDSGPWTEQVYNDSVAGFIDSGLPSGATFYYVVAATNAAGVSPLSEPASGTTTGGSGVPLAPSIILTLNPPDVPAAPTVDAGTVTASSMDLSWGVGSASATVLWGPVNGATSFNLYWKEGSTVTKETGTKIAGVNFPVTVPGLAYETQYSFIVTALNALGESDASNVATTTPTVSFQVYREDDGEAFIHQSWCVYDGVGTGFTNAGLVDDWTYAYSLRATNPTGSSGLSNPVSGTTDSIIGDPSDYCLTGGTPRTLSPNVLYAVQINLISGDVNGFGVHSCSSGPRIRMALYTNASGSPDVLVAESITTRMVSGSTDCNMEMLNSTFDNVTSGLYWVVVIVEETAEVFVDETAAKVPFATKALDFSQPFPTPFGTVTPVTDYPHGFYVVASFM